MWDETKLRATLTRVIERAGGEVEASLGGGRMDVTRFAQNAITQHVSEDDLVLTVRLADGEKTGRATTNRLDDAGIGDCIERARTALRLSAPVPGLLRVPGPMPVEPLPVHDAKTASLTPEARSEVVAACIAAAKEKGLKASGIYQTDASSAQDYEGPAPFAIANSAGHVVTHARTRSIYSVTVEAGGSASGWAQAGSHRASDFDPLALTKIAIDKALAGRDAVEVPAGDYTVLLEPEAVSNLLHFLSEGFSAAAVDEGRSFLTEPGEHLFGEEITISDDVRHPLAFGCPFDREGVPRQPVTLVTRGVHTGLVHSRASALRHGVLPTGHGLGQPSTLDSWPASLILAGTDRTFDDLVRETKRGILVTRFWYCRLVDKKRIIVTGMTRDGTFVVEDGKPVRAARNLRFNVSVLDVLRAVEARSREQWATGCVVPGLRVNGFRFTSTTTA